ncbi:hypothetical protein [Brevibacillus laterosporus]|uniref:hypothetical protein n=1 Tax=Brevibacillus laterosporus TaxID=1465 RepID=UPI003D254B47
MSQVNDERLSKIYNEIENTEGTDIADKIKVESVDAPTVNKPKTIDTLEDAARYAYGLSETRKNIAQIEAIADSEIAIWQDKIDQVIEWRNQSIKPLQEKVDYISTLLTQFHIKTYSQAPNEKARGKVTSIKLPYDITLSSRAQQTKIEVIDNDALLSYAKENNLVDIPEPKAKWNEIKKKLLINNDGRVYDPNGEEVAFVKVTPQERKFEVK